MLGGLGGLALGLLSLILTLAAILATLWLSDSLSGIIPWPGGMVEEGSALPATALVVYAAVGIPAGAALYLLRDRVRKPFAGTAALLRAAGALLGAGIGLARGAASLFVLVLIASYLDREALRPLWKDSLLLQAFSIRAVVWSRQLPHPVSQLDAELRGILYEEVSVFPSVSRELERIADGEADDGGDG